MALLQDPDEAGYSQWHWIVLRLLQLWLESSVVHPLLAAPPDLPHEQIEPLLEQLARLVGSGSCLDIVPSSPRHDHVGPKLIPHTITRLTPTISFDACCHALRFYDGVELTDTRPLPRLHSTILHILLGHPHKSSSCIQLTNQCIRMGVLSGDIKTPTHEVQKAICVLRDLLEDTPCHTLIRTKRGLGYSIWPIN